MANLYIAQAYGYAGDDGNIVWEYQKDIFNGLDGTSPTVGGNNKYNIYYLGIQTCPGVQFIIDNNQTDGNGTIRIGQTGIFELNLEDSDAIQSVSFQNLSSLIGGTTKDHNVNYCLIDVIYSKSNNS